MADEQLRLADLFCGAGGAASGYHDAGFEIVGFDIEPQPNYPFEFVQKDVFTLSDFSGFNAIHASPPCQFYSSSHYWETHRPLIKPIRKMLKSTGLPYVIENVEGARPFMIKPIRLCGSSFGLDLWRHRLFETNWKLPTLACDHSWQVRKYRSANQAKANHGRLSKIVTVYGNIKYPGEFELRCAAMGIDWMTNKELVEAIPPAYTKYIGDWLVKNGI